MGISPAFVLDRGASNCDRNKIKSTLFNHKERSEFILDLAKQGFDSPLFVILKVHLMSALYGTIWLYHSTLKGMLTNVGR